MYLFHRGRILRLQSGRVLVLILAVITGAFFGIRARTDTTASGDAGSGSSARYSSGASRLTPPLAESRAGTATPDPDSTTASYTTREFTADTGDPASVSRPGRRTRTHRRRRGLLRPGARLIPPVLPGRRRSGLIRPRRRRSSGPGARPHGVGMRVWMRVRVGSAPSVRVVGVIRNANGRVRLLLGQNRHVGFASCLFNSDWAGGEGKGRGGGRVLRLNVLRSIHNRRERSVYPRERP